MDELLADLYGDIVENVPKDPDEKKLEAKLVNGHWSMVKCHWLFEKKYKPFYIKKIFF